MIVQVCEENLRVLLFFCLANRWTSDQRQVASLRAARNSEWKMCALSQPPAGATCARYQG